MKSKRQSDSGRYYVSEKKKSQLYNAISNPIIDLRIDIAKNNTSAKDIDGKLFSLTETIWKDISAILKIKQP